MNSKLPDSACEPESHGLTVPQGESQRESQETTTNSFEELRQITLKVTRLTHLRDLLLELGRAFSRFWVGLSSLSEPRSSI
jgi:hypothetical protein